MALKDYSNKIRAPVMQVYILEKDVVPIDTLISSGTMTLNSNARTHLYSIVPSTDFTDTQGFKFDNKRLKSVKLPKMGIPTQKDPFLGYDSDGMQQYDIILSDDPDTMISWECKLDGSEHELIYPKADQNQATTTHAGYTIKRAGIRVGQEVITKDVLVILDGTIGNSNGKRIAHFFEDVALTFTPEEGTADNKADIKGRFEGVATKHYIEKEA
jgi:hypothetical protein